MDTTNKLAEEASTATRERAANYTNAQKSAAFEWLRKEALDETQPLAGIAFDVWATLATPSADQATQPAEAVAWLRADKYGNLDVVDSDVHGAFPVCRCATHPASASASEPAIRQGWDVDDLLSKPASVAGAGEAQAECVQCERCGHENWIMEGKAPCQITAADKAAALAARPVAEGEAELPPLPGWVTNAAKPHIAKGMQDYAREAVRNVLAHQAPAPLSQAVPDGFWLAPMEPDSQMRSAMRKSNLMSNDGGRLDAVMNAAAGMLPDGYEVRVCVERHAGWVELLNEEADNVASTFDGDHTLSEQVVICVQKAIADAARAATSGSEGEGR